MRNWLNRLAPRSRVDVLWKGMIYCAAIAVWHVIWARFLFGDASRPVSVLVSDAIFVGGPFAFLFAIGSWTQVTGIRSLLNRAHIDPLSGLYNRQTFMDRATSSIAASRRGLLLLIDADDFKSVNDHMGHAVGDTCISAIGHRLKWHLRDEDVAGRVGGEEFAVFLPNVSPAHARVVGERVGQPVTFAGGKEGALYSITLSIGAAWADSETSLDALFADADEALYRAKESGRARLCFADGAPDIALGDATGRRKITSRPISRGGALSRLTSESRTPPAGVGDRGKDSLIA